MAMHIMLPDGSTARRYVGADGRPILHRSSYTHGDVGMQEGRVMWSQRFGAIPPGYIVHHLDGNPLNNEIDNLRCMLQGDHARLHLSGKSNTRCECGRQAIAKGLCRQCYSARRYRLRKLGYGAEVTIRYKRRGD